MLNATILSNIHSVVHECSYKTSPTSRKLLTKLCIMLHMEKVCVSLLKKFT